MRGFFIAASAALPLLAGAAPATLESVFPAGGQPGREIDFTLSGKLEPWPVSLWFSAKGISFVPDKDKPGTGKLKIDASVPEGAVYLRAHNAEGASAPQLFIIGSRTELREEEKDNSTLAGALPLDRTKLPFTVNGTLSTGGELDAYRIALEKGETLHARVEAYGLRSLVDPALHLHDASGHRLLLAHDGARNLDPGIRFSAPAKGDYLLSLAGFSHPPAASVAYTGSKNAHYRLSLALQEADLPPRLRPSDPGPDSAAPEIATGKPVVGTLREKGKGNRHVVTAKKGDKFLIRVEGRSLGYPIDPVMRLLKPDGAELRREDDTNKETDPEYLWSVAEDGVYTIEVLDRFGRAGEEMRYRLSVAVPQPGFSATVDKDGLILERGKPAELKVTVTRRHGHTAALDVLVEGLPAGIAPEAPAKIAEKGGEVVLKLEAKPDTPAFAGPFRIVLSDPSAESVTGKETAAFSFRSDNWRGPYALDEITELWLTLPPKKEEKKEEPKKEASKSDAKAEKK